MHRILVNTFITGYRRRRRDRLTFTESSEVVERSLEAAGIEPPGQDEGLGDEVTLALARLPEEFRRVLILVDIDEHSYREAAERIGCPVGTVMSRLHRARRAMQEQLREFAASEGYLARGCAPEPWAPAVAC
jgi:RNA polymerase sigma-70 factor (ECF subfamily)